MVNRRIRVPGFHRLATATGAALLCMATNLASAASVSYFLDQSNTSPPFSDGANYLTVTIDDEGGIGAAGDSIITFTVETVPGAFNQTGAFGIQSFGFSDTGGFITGDSPSAAWLLPTDWIGNIPQPSNQLSGFGRFDVAVSTSGSASRMDPLVFSLDAAGDSIDNYVALSSGNAGEGNAFFAAHVAGFSLSGPGVTSAWFGGSTAVPVPAAVWLFVSGLLGLAGFARGRHAA